MRYLLDISLGLKVFHEDCGMLVDRDCGTKLLQSVRDGEQKASTALINVRGQRDRSIAGMTNRKLDLNKFSLAGVQLVTISQQSEVRRISRGKTDGFDDDLSMVIAQDNESLNADTPHRTLHENSIGILTQPFFSLGKVILL